MEYDKTDLLEALGGVDIADVGTNLNEEAAQQEQAAIQEVGVSSEQVQALAKQDLDFFAGFAMPYVFTYCFPDVFKQGVWPWLLDWVNKDRAFPQLALGLPRGFAKSTLMKFFLLYCILFTDKKRLWVFSGI